MAARKKSKKVTKSKPTARAKAKRAKRTAERQTPKERSAKRKKRTTTSKRHGQRSGNDANRVYSHKEGVVFEAEKTGSRTGGQSGDLQGLRDLENADSESVEELLEEGNAFEADVVAGVEHVEDNEEREVHTHEVPEDDVPEEYQDKD